ASVDGGNARNAERRLRDSIQEFGDVLESGGKSVDAIDQHDLLGNDFLRRFEVAGKEAGEERFGGLAGRAGVAAAEFEGFVERLGGNLVEFEVAQRSVEAPFGDEPLFELEHFNDALGKGPPVVAL